MNSSNKGNSQGNRPDTQGGSQDNQQGSSSGAQQSSEQNFVLVDFDEGLDIGDEQFILGEVRRADRARNRQSSEGQNQQGGEDKSSG
ncbi:hypothetical protein [Janthinobacterium fluminis]|uniref:Uncharacterized protein n=1 Tax=Janthinobacterium fluminis TaxID=2987524 RepID=A0ABT5K4W9_9BURK|nr:hypothetical protein [Janthinobacterium fluminis]MDC8759146.1 hypothetical protein [Janthinobacterium fluminis]